MKKSLILGAIFATIITTSSPTPAVAQLQFNCPLDIPTLVDIIKKDVGLADKLKVPLDAFYNFPKTLPREYFDCIRDGIRKATAYDIVPYKETGNSVIYVLKKRDSI